MTRLVVFIYYLLFIIYYINLKKYPKTPLPHKAKKNTTTSKINQIDLNKMLDLLLVYLAINSSIF